jgi:hypothetical protein
LLDVYSLDILQLRRDTYGIALRKGYITRDVTFFENEPFFSKENASLPCNASLTHALPLTQVQDKMEAIDSTISPSHRKPF